MRNCNAVYQEQRVSDRTGNGRRLFLYFYDSDLHEIHFNDYDDPKVSVQKATYEILKSERMDDMECVKSGL